MKILDRATCFRASIHHVRAGDPEMSRDSLHSVNGVLKRAASIRALLQDSYRAEMDTMAAASEQAAKNSNESLDYQEKDVNISDDLSCFSGDDSENSDDDATQVTSNQTSVRLKKRLRSDTDTTDDHHSEEEDDDMISVQSNLATEDTKTGDDSDDKEAGDVQPHPSFLSAFNVISSRLPFSSLRDVKATEEPQEGAKKEPPRRHSAVATFLTDRVTTFKHNMGTLRDVTGDRVSTFKHNMDTLADVIIGGDLEEDEESQEEVVDATEMMLRELEAQLVAPSKRKED